VASASGLRITQLRSSSGSSPTQRATLRSLGLKGIGRSVEHSDGPQLRGMVRVVQHLVQVSESTSRKPKADAEKGDENG
jgi:large subunit ribosomal protein L30